MAHDPFQNPVTSVGLFAANAEILHVREQSRNVLSEMLATVASERYSKRNMLAPMILGLGVGSKYGAILKQSPRGKKKTITR